MAEVENRLTDVFAATRVNPWRAGYDLAAKRFNLTPEVAGRGIGFLKGEFARVLPREGEPKRFRLAEASERAKAVPCLLLRLDEWPWSLEDDVLALSLTPESRRFWRWTAKVPVIGEPKLTASGSLLLNEDAHRYIGRVIRASASARSAEDERRDVVARGFARARAESRLDGMVAARALPIDDPRRLAYLTRIREALKAGEDAAERWRLETRWPDGELVLDPTALDWTKRGGLAGVESIEILDAPAMGALGRALKALNTNIGTKRGVDLYGHGEAAQRRRAA
jgi:plasmid stability protein